VMLFQAVMKGERSIGIRGKVYWHKGKGLLASQVQVWISLIKNVFSCVAAKALKHKASQGKI
jgi:hypothetical protein